MAHTKSTTEARVHVGQNWRLRLETITTGSTQAITGLTTASTFDYRDPNGTTGALGPITADSTRFTIYDITSETTVSGWWHFNTHVVIGASTFIGNTWAQRIFRKGYMD